jgi:hypothetical protein
MSDQSLSDQGLEAPEADTAEQETDAVPDPEDADEDQLDVPLEADVADSAEQAREVGLGEDEDYR